MTLRVLFADDEETGRRRLRRMLESEDDVVIVAECTSGAEALELLETVAIDVALLDVEMGAVSGLDVSKVALGSDVSVVFLTAHSQHAVDAFAQGAVDYLLKPFDEERLRLALDRVRRRLAHAAAADDARPESGTSLSGSVPRLALGAKGEIRLVAPERISHVVLEGSLVHVWVDGECILSERTINDLERRLTGFGFERVHRRALLSLAHVDRLKPLPTGGYDAVTTLGHVVPVSRQAARELRRRLKLE